MTHLILAIRILFWQEDSITHMHGLAIYVKEGLPSCMGLISRKLFRLLPMFLTGFASLSVNSFSSTDHLLLYAQFLIQFYLI